MRLTIAAGFFLLLAACSTSGGPSRQTASQPTASSEYIVAAIADPRRPQADRDRDADRHPADILAFAEVMPGERIADVGPGGGYYTRLFSNIAAEGKVYAIIRTQPPNPERQPPILAVAAEAGYGNIVVSQQEFTNWSLPEPLDTIFISQIYHDFHLTRLNLDVAAANRSMFNALKPGGRLVVIDHSAVAGTPATAVDTLHRIDEAVVRRELEAAGFVYEAGSEVLRNSADPRTEEVHQGAIRGHTDQFVMRFRKPG